mmetsp:Transcript_14369/g.48679  ORF Transcript_14369/g.48679 Transcript_14369/m.48679 type:complete len:382 (-) Transcript_14369:28-1173(-)
MVMHSLPQRPSTSRKAPQAFEEGEATVHDGELPAVSAHDALGDSHVDRIIGDLEAGADNTGMLALPSKAKELARIHTGSLIRAEDKVDITHARGFLMIKGEDKCASTKLELDGGVEAIMHGVFDGHGGARASEFCAAHMAEEIVAAYAKKPSLPHEARLKEALVDAFEAVHDKVVRISTADDGTTATVVVFDYVHVYIANVGDSAAYLSLGELPVERLTADHRLDRNEAEQRRAVAAGATLGRFRGADGKPRGPLRLYPGGLAVSRSIGDGDSTAAVIPTPDVKMIPMPRQASYVLLASDGIWDFITEPQVDKVLAAARKHRWRLSKVVGALVRVVRDRNEDIDDGTLICIHVPEPGSTTPPNRGGGKGGGESLAKRMLGV